MAAAGTDLHCGLCSGDREDGIHVRGDAQSADVLDDGGAGAVTHRGVGRAGAGPVERTRAGHANITVARTSPVLHEAEQAGIRQCRDRATKNAVRVRLCWAALPALVFEGVAAEMLRR